MTPVRGLSIQFILQRARDIQGFFCHVSEDVSGTKIHIQSVDMLKNCLPSQLAGLKFKKIITYIHGMVAFDEGGISKIATAILVVLFQPQVFWKFHDYLKSSCVEFAGWFQEVPESEAVRERFVIFP